MKILHGVAVAGVVDFCSMTWIRRVNAIPYNSRIRPPPTKITQYCLVKVRRSYLKLLIFVSVCKQKRYGDPERHAASR